MRAYATILCLLLTVPVYAVDTLQVTTPDPVLEQWRWTSFDRASGLAGGVRDIYEDRDGSIWFATVRGVHRYDGYRWTTYTTKDGLAHDHVRTVIQTRALSGSQVFKPPALPEVMTVVPKSGRPPPR